MPSDAAEDGDEHLEPPLISVIAGKFSWRHLLVAGTTRKFSMLLWDCSVLVFIWKLDMGNIDFMFMRDSDGGNS